jgi:Zn-finger nucleic acid-binding protein
MDKLQCPKCKAAMEPVQIEQTQVDRCTSCRGLWFDALEDQDIRESEAAESLDSQSGGSRLAPERSAKAKPSAIDCPRCKAPMIQMVDRMGRRVQYESCPRCHGKFLDAGEFKALEPRGVQATMRRLFKGKQRKG